MVAPEGHRRATSAPSDQDASQAQGEVERIAAMARDLIDNYEQRPGGYERTLEVLRYAAALSPQGLDAKEGKKRVAFYWEAGSDIREGESLSDRDRRIYEQGRRDERAGEPEAFQ